MRCNPRALLGAVMTVLCLAAATAQTTRYFTFATGQWPSWTYADVALHNCSGTPDYQLFQPAGGVLQQRMAGTPACNAFFYGGSLPGGPTPTTAGLDRWTRTVIEARFAVLGGNALGGAPGGIPILWQHTIGRAALRLDLAAGALGLESATGTVWLPPPANWSSMQTYRMVVEPNGGAPTVSLWVNDVLLAGPWPTALEWVHDGWGFGDGSAGTDAVDIDWDYFSIAQGAPGPGMANQGAAMLFAGRNNWFPGGPQLGAPGFAGPFRVVGLGGQFLELQWGGPAGAPFALLVAPSPGPARPFGCGGTLDIGTAAGFSDVAVVFDPTVPIFGSLFTLSSWGYSAQALQVPSLPPGLLIGAIQGVVFQPAGSAGCGYRLTAAFELRS